MEFLRFAGPRRVRRVLDSFTDVDVRVLLTVRDLATALPSQWQTLVYNGGKSSWPGYLAAVPEPGVPSRLSLRFRRRLAQHIHRTQNYPRMLRMWGGELPTGSLHVVTLPGSNAAPGELWRRMAGVVGVDPAVATKPAARSNASLGYASTELVRRINQHIARLPHSEYNATIKQVALHDLAPRAEVEARAQLSRAAYDLALGWNALTRKTIRDTGAVVAGDVEWDLPVTPDAGLRERLRTAINPPDPGDMLDAAEVAASGLDRLTNRRVRRLAKAGIASDVDALGDPQALRRRWESSNDPVTAAAVDLANAVHKAAVLLRRIRAERMQGRQV